MSVANQTTVKIAARMPRNKDNPYTMINVDALQQAMCRLKSGAFVLWMYLNKNVDGYTFDLSQKACEAWGIKKDAYYSARQALIDEGYLEAINEEGTIFNFYEMSPISAAEVKKRKADKKVSGIQKDSSEKPKEWSVFDF